MSTSQTGSSPGVIPYVIGSMEPYKFEVFQQCFAATQAWNRALDRLDKVPTGGPHASMLAALHIISDVQAFAVAVGILSDLFFPSGPADKARGERLCTLYGVTSDSPLSNAQVQVRHALVHIDRELDHWLQSQVGKPVGPVAIQPWEGPVPTKATSNAARIIDNQRWRIFVLGNVMDLKPLILEIGRVAIQFPLEYCGPSGEPLFLRMDPPR
jgi:hypothetical protein